jgi:hypothetical protein
VYSLVNFAGLLSTLMLWIYDQLQPNGIAGHGGTGEWRDLH